MKSSKGGAFEREICKLLSLWWTQGKRDDVFWRTQSSGARATIRSKSKKGTYGQCGDIQATDPIGKPLMDLCSFELKTGYKSAGMQDLVDRMEQHHPLYEQFMEQSRDDARKADVPFWSIIARRHGKSKMIYTPHLFYREIREHTKLKRLKEIGHMRIRVPRYENPDVWWNVMGFLLEDFLWAVNPKTIKRIHESYQK